MDNIVIKAIYGVTINDVDLFFQKIEHLIQNLNLPVHNSSQIVENLFRQKGYEIPIFSDIWNGNNYTLTDTKAVIIVTDNKSYKTRNYRTENIYVKTKELNIPIRIIIA